MLRENAALCLEMENSIRRQTGLRELTVSPAFALSDSSQSVRVPALKGQERDQTDGHADQAGGYAGEAGVLFEEKGFDVETT